MATNWALSVEKGTEIVARRTLIAPNRKAEGTKGVPVAKDGSDTSQNTGEEATPITNPGYLNGFVVLAA